MAATDDAFGGVRLQHLASEPLLLVCPGQHRLAREPSITLDLLADQSFIDFPVGWGSRALVDRAFAAAGLRRTVAYEAADPSSALGLVRNGLGVTFLTAGAGDLTGLSVREVIGADLRRPILLATAMNRAPSAAGAALAHHLLGVRTVHTRAGARPSDAGPGSAPVP